ncbi:hypothetical protein [Pectinatus frisingensis]|uniref:hypothetical protein n=1 Tax=Pectinatus frisingensis TaxID=865 RepID=UPI0018C7625B|nr:hypothetical protein [Pectinatus frisingensis]
MESIKMIKGWQNGKDEKFIGWQKSKSGIWHLVSESLIGTFKNDENYPICQSYNFDRPNFLDGEIVDTPPENEKICKKCLSHLI